MHKVIKFHIRMWFFRKTKIKKASYFLWLLIVTFFVFIITFIISILHWYSNIYSNKLKTCLDFSLLSLLLSRSRALLFDVALPDLTGDLDLCVVSWRPSVGVRGFLLFFGLVLFFFGIVKALDVYILIRFYEQKI